MKITYSRLVSLPALLLTAALLAVPAMAFAAPDASDSLQASIVVVDDAQPEALVKYRVQVRGDSWSAWAFDGETAGRAAGSTRINRFAIALGQSTLKGGIKYRVHLSGGKWKAWKKNGAKTGSFTNVDAIQIKLTGALAKEYDVVYRANIKGAKWLKRVRNGATAGTTTTGKAIRALRVQLVPKSERSGWVGKKTSWKYYKDGKLLKSQWVTTKEPPVNVLAGSASGSRRYWLDSTGKLAVGRIIDPQSKRDAGAGFMAYATQWGTLLTDTVKMINKKWYAADEDGVLTRSTKNAAHIERYVKWAIKIAKNDSHGYSQANRWGPDYDCSSLVVSALAKNGFQVGSAVWTGNLRSELTKYGFRWYTNFSKLKRGDILLVHNSIRQHTEIYIGGGKTVGAHIAETGGIYGKAGDQTGNEISVGPYYAIWEGYLRYVG